MRLTRIFIAMVAILGGIMLHSTVMAGTPPTIDSITSTTTNGTYGIGDEIWLTINFSESIYTSGSITMDLNSSSTATCIVSAISSSTPAASGSCLYTVADGDSTSDLNADTISGDIFNVGGDQLVNFSPGVELASSKELVVNTVPPVAPTILSIGSEDSNGYYGIGDSVQVDVTFSETIYSVGDITLSFNSSASSTCQFAVSSSTPSTIGSCDYTIQLGDSTDDLNVETVSGDIYNASSTPMTNFVPVQKLAAVKNIIADGVLPTITTVTYSAGDGIFGFASVIPLSIAMSELVTTVGTTTLYMSSASSTATCLIPETSTATTTLGCNYTVDSGDATDNLFIYWVGSTDIFDVAGNELTDTDQTSPSINAIIIDTEAPIASFSGEPDSETTDTTTSMTIYGTDVDYYKYKLDSGAWTDSATPTSTVLALSGLSIGEHTLYIIGADTAYNWQPTASSTNHTWEVITSSPGGGGGGGGGSSPPEPQVLGLKIYSYSSGRMVKTASDSAIYHITDDGKRHLYPNEVTYWTWHTGTWADQEIEIISQADFDALEQGNNITVQPDTKLVRFFNSSRVYIVSEEATISYLSPDVAIELYGDTWEENIIMIQNGFESNYYRGEAIIL